MHNDHFDPLTVSLEGSNLIEASAGTGKTYSIAIMTLRLIVEKKTPIRKILMVTFTKAAVAELELRVRSFVRQALKVSRGQAIGDKTIEAMVRRQMTGGREQEVRDLLTAAQVMLDETSVMTIHSFCQKVLREYSFETGQVFGAKTLTPEEFGQISSEAFREFWRQHITTLHVKILERLLVHEENFNRKTIYEIVQDGISGKILALSEPIPIGFLSQPWQLALAEDTNTSKQLQETLRKQITDDLTTNRDAYLISIARNKSATKAYHKILTDGDWEKLTNALLKTNNEYPRNLFPNLMEIVDRLNAVIAAQKLSMKVLLNLIAKTAFLAVNMVVDQRKERTGHITFDDMIKLVHAAVCTGASREALRNHLRHTYDAVFIDEFQDTDRQQYHIFETLFGQANILFYIGDPKQSIYAWRKADVFTYFDARASVQHLHLMNVNHRSTEEFLEAMNGFFKPTKDFDTFHYKDNQSAIEYLPVSTPNPNTRGTLLYEGAPVTHSLRISSHKNKKQLIAGLSDIMKELMLSGKYSILPQGSATAEAIIPNDIGILVRTNKEGRAVKELLTQLKIPAITIDDSRIFASAEALDLYYVMIAVNEISRANINRALFTHLGGFDKERLLCSDEDDILKRFRKYQETWKSDGVYVMLRCFLADRGIDRLFEDPDLRNPERMASNILQLVEIMHKVSLQKRYDPSEQIQWFKKGIDGDLREGNEYEQRIESDEQAVKIATIHKSKGLEYKIVIAPHLDFVENRKITTYSYRDPNDKEYYVIDKSLLEKGGERWVWATEQAEQENRRLLYVAVTRARYLCIITASTASYYNNSTLRKFRDTLAAVAGGLPGIETEWKIPEFFPVSGPAGTAKAIDRKYAVAKDFRLVQTEWRKASYSGLSPKHDPVPMRPPTDAELVPYDRFVFRDIRRGAHTGNLLHHIFEHIDFSNDRFLPDVIGRSIRRLSTPKDNSFHEQLTKMVRHVTRTRIIPGSDFTLSQLERDRRLNELEFDYPLELFNTNQIMALSNENTPLRVDADRTMEGIMNGKIDLLFEASGKFYVLDWKSNYLGDNLADYGTASVEAAMAENNYHLQYHIYSVAACKYLATRLPNFEYEKDFGGVAYLFLRGVREGMETGIFFRKPELSVIRGLEALTKGLPAS